MPRDDGVVGYRICLTHRRSSVRAWVDSYHGKSTFCLFSFFHYAQVFHITHSSNNFFFTYWLVNCIALYSHTSTGYKLILRQCISLHRAPIVTSTHCNPPIWILNVRGRILIVAATSTRDKANIEFKKIQELLFFSERETEHLQMSIS